MSRYRGPRLKIIRRLGNSPGLTNKTPKSKKIGSDQSISRKISQYCIRLEAKQKLRFNHGLTERQLLKYVRTARRASGSTGQVSLQLLEMRLDNIIFRLGISPTIPGARQLVNHRHILVNDRIVDIPSYHCKANDVITVRDQNNSRNLIGKDVGSSAEGRIPNHLSLSLSEDDKLKGFVNRMIDRESIGLKVNELLIVEYYSRQA